MEQTKENQEQEALAWLQHCLPLLPLNAAHWMLTSAIKASAPQHETNEFTTTSFYRPYSKIVKV